MGAGAAGIPVVGSIGGTGCRRRIVPNKAALSLPSKAGRRAA
jgi:hypothetical protein